MKKYLAEMLWTMTLVLMWCGAAVLAGGEIWFLGISFAFGLAVLAMVYAIGHISGCHINPAITFAMWVDKQIKTKDAIMYVIFQVIGAIIGAAILYAIAQWAPWFELAAWLGQNGFGINSPAQYSMIAWFIAEVVFTAIFLLVIFGVTSKEWNNKFAWLAIGLALTLIHIVGIPVTGVSVNPARSIGPALLVWGDAISQLWLFIAAPLLGALIGRFIRRHLLSQSK